MSIEYGGRFQIPLFRGEIAFTYHNRRMNLSKGRFAHLPPDEKLVPEKRIALDGKWDIGIGFWFEGPIIYQDSEFLPFTYLRLVEGALSFMKHFFTLSFPLIR